MGALLSANAALAQTRTTNAVLRAFVCLVELFGAGTRLLYKYSKPDLLMGYRRAVGTYL